MYVRAKNCADTLQDTAAVTKNIQSSRNWNQKQRFQKIFLSEATIISVAKRLHVV
jgi:hypothetical protein